ncbi:pyruvate kinase [soil metagenome]
MNQHLLHEIEPIISRLKLIRHQASHVREHFAGPLLHVHPDNLASALNLIHYISVRQHDLRDLQIDLGRLGLSSLGRMESHVLATLDAVLSLLHKLGDRSWDGRTLHEILPEFETHSARLKQNTATAFGEPPVDRQVRIMVTMPSEAADDPLLIRDFLDRGMNVMRINCAHDGPDQWQRMVKNLRLAERETGKFSQIAFDLAGPKLRTGPMQLSPGVIRWKPHRNELGQVIDPAFVNFSIESRHPNNGAVWIPIKGQLQHLARQGDRVKLVDTRGRERVLPVVVVDKTSCVCTCDHTGYVIQGIKLELYRGNQLIGEDEVGSLPPVEHAIPLSVGDDLLLTPGDIPGGPAIGTKTDSDYQPAQIGCSLDAIFTDARQGERVFFDDGKMGGVIRNTHRDGEHARIEIEITHAANGRAKLRPEKGINLPDTQLKISALTAKDHHDLEFVVKHGDLVSLSFVRRAEDVTALIDRLDELKASETGIILKIENRAAVDNLPEILLTAMRRSTTAVMVARGDLGVEIGFERMAEIQEEILWICEAAHVPVIWATQVLDSLAQRGLPSRAEVTDAAMSGRAECVMLNKGPHILLALDFLCDVLSRMKGHQTKKFSLMRKLNMAQLAMK